MYWKATPDRGGGRRGLPAPPLPSGLRREVGTALLATLVGLAAGCLVLLAIEAASYGPDHLQALAFDFWFHTDFVPGFLPGFAASAALAALTSLVVRNGGHRLARRAAERRQP